MSEAMDATRALVARYYAAFNEGDVAGMLDCLSDDVAHHVNEGAVRRGKEAFAAFCAHMSDCYREELTDIVVMASPDGTRAAAEFTVNGTYLSTDAGLPEARGQTYVLPAGGFFTVADGRIARVVTYYNLADWVRQVSA
ncbi:nuclear transport factor 2 family protein [Roseibacterium sp. SDUM158016]|uniref:ketosteroid isomerase-related protein n=1 Tax=Roseicyclus sediminis TaxID=2980997 RepID=UPI0021CDF7E9|nr:ketosteroid isomerase-related protein [Roseibacterium sp. SDUM158016]MCU4653474.1 nuclear transport factor 2 family protein [Roseibacterium sp. SDUM158016]